MTAEFLLFHEKCNALEYKVHTPGCTCLKMKNVRFRAQQQQLQQKHELADSSVEKEDTQREEANDSLLDSLVVVPSSGRISTVYSCLGTGIQTFSLDSRAAEVKLRHEIFWLTKNKTTNSAPLKVNCANCLLQVEPNGFVCVSSTSRSTVDLARDLARNEAKRRSNDDKKGLHSSHADYVCTLSRQALWNLHSTSALKNTKTELEIKSAREQVIDELLKQGAQIQPEASIELGHHLTSLLDITDLENNATGTYWLAIVYDNSKDENKWNIDLPGGKRHLGELAFDCAVRRTEEETSLVIDETWEMTSRLLSKGDAGSEFFTVRPSVNLIMEQVMKKTF